MMKFRVIAPRIPRLRLMVILIFFICFPFIAVQSRAQALPEFDFTKPSTAREWGAPHDLRLLASTAEGLPLEITGHDPYFYGPPRDFPEGELLWMRLRLKSQQSGPAQVFYFQTGATEENSVRFFVSGGDWTEIRVPLPALASRTHLRIDPPGTGGTCILGKISFEIRPTIAEPAWLKPAPPPIPENAPRVSSGNLAVVHGSSSLGAFEVRVENKRMAIGHTTAMLGYTHDGNVRWLALTNPVTVSSAGGSLQVRTEALDPDGARWKVEQLFRPSASPAAIEVESQVTVSQDRSVVFLPMFTLLPGVGSFGTNKSQALLAGVEYLENEPSSSEADMVGPASRRQVPDSLKLTFPLMALAAEGNYIGLAWEQQPHFAALHDSPDRIFKSGGHAMGILYPGADPAIREDGSVLPYGGQLLRANTTLTLRATILGGRGETVIPAVQEYVRRRGLPEIPKTGYTAETFFALAARSWLDSEIRDGAKFRHAVGPTFGSSPAADAALYIDWLATSLSSDRPLNGRLTELSRNARSVIRPELYNAAAVGHVRMPVQALVYGAVAENAGHALAEGKNQLGLFQADGSILFRPPSNGMDLGRTHFSREANGLTATHVMTVLERAVFSGDVALTQEGLRLLRALNKFHNTVPRGAQTWEVPLHTPDILGSGYLVRAYTLGYELTGEQEFLDQARYWAWTGVPFVYLTPPNDRPVGVYSTIAVLGATQFVAPVWIGLPVQWCGLVYGHAVRRLAAYDPNGPWLKLADGIAAAGVQHTHTAEEPAYQGLLPDSFDLRNQARNLVPINPATLLPEAIQMFGKPAVYDYRILRKFGAIIHAPGPITEVKEESGRVTFRVKGWPREPWYVLVNGLKTIPSIKLNGTPAQLAAPHQFQATEGRLILRCEGTTTVEIIAK